MRRFCTWRTGYAGSYRFNATGWQPQYNQFDPTVQMNAGNAGVLRSRRKTYGTASGTGSKDNALHRRLLPVLSEGKKGARQAEPALRGGLRGRRRSGRGDKALRPSGDPDPHHRRRGAGGLLLHHPRTPRALRLARAVQLLQGVGDVVGGGVLGAVLQEGASLADRVGGDLRELEYETLAPIRCVAPGAVGGGAATQYLAQVAAETAHERVEDRHARSTPLPLAQRREQ